MKGKKKRPKNYIFQLHKEDIQRKKTERLLPKSDSAFEWPHIRCLHDVGGECGWFACCLLLNTFLRSPNF